MALVGERTVRQAPDFTTRSRSSKAARFYRPELDMLRLLAFLMVWLAHALLAFSAAAPPRLLLAVEGLGSCGVPIFFFLSAFLITELLVRERLLTGAMHLEGFYVRRMLRIWPLYLGGLLAYGLLGLRWHGFRIEPGRLLASVLLAGNWYIVFHPAITTPMRALWSVSVEEQWYLLWPQLLRDLSRKQLLLACFGIILAAQALLVILAHGSGNLMLAVTAWDNSGVQFQFFALGAAAALLLDGRIPELRLRSRGLLGCMAATLLLAASALCHIKEPAIVHTSQALVSGYLLIGAGTVCLFFSFYGVPAAYCSRTLIRLGQLSFGLYVFHETGFFLANAVARWAAWPATVPALLGEKLLALLLAVVFAFGSYHAWELPFLRLKQRWTFVRTREAQ